MSTTTKNYNFVLPSLSDRPPDITATNSNWEMVDQKLKDHEVKISESANIINSLSDEMDNLDSSKLELTSATAALYGLSGPDANVDKALAANIELSSYMIFAGNVNNGQLCSAFIPCSIDEYSKKQIMLGYQVAKYLFHYVTDITLTLGEIALLSTKNTWWDVCTDVATKSIIKRSASFVTKINTIPFASYVFNNYATLQSFLAEVNALYSTALTSIADLKKDTTIMQQLMNNITLCRLIGYNSSIEPEFYGAGGENITLLSGSGNFTVPANVTNINYQLVGGGSGTSAGKVLSGTLAVTQGQVISYAVAAKGSAGNTTFGTLTSANGASISDNNSGLLGRAPNGTSGEANSSAAGGAGGTGGVGFGAGGGGGNGGGQYRVGGYGGGGNEFLGSGGQGGYNNSSGSGKGTVYSFIDSIIRITAYREATRNTILLNKAIQLGVFGGAGGGGGGGATSATNGWCGSGGGGGGAGYGAGAGSYGTYYASGLSGSGTGSNGGAGACGAAGGTGGAVNNSGSVGTPACGVIFLMW